MEKLSPLDIQLHEDFSLAGQNAREWTRKCALLLPEIDRRRIWRKKKFGSIFEYAAKLAGMSHASVEDALRIGRKIEPFPELLAVAREKGLQRVRPVLSVVTPETEGFWADKAKSMSKMTLQSYVKNVRLESRSRTAGEPENVEVRLRLRASLAKRIEVLEKHRDFEGALERFLDHFEAQITLSQPASVLSKSRYVPVVVKRAVLERTTGLCAFPSCKNAASSLHHTQRFALEKVHDPTRLQPVCTAHERIAHLGLIENEELPPDRWELRLDQDRNSAKFYVDQFVQMYRHNAIGASP